ncbi:MAG: hypothetical protein ACXAAI_10625 [Promethearchaeota archaeon]
MGNKKLSRPRCESCGNRIYRIYSPFRKSIWRDIPSHCPRCGKQITFDKKVQLDEHDALIWLLSCFGVIVIIVVIFIIF